MIKKVKKVNKKNKDDLEWHRTFNNESTQWSFRLSVLVIGFLGLGILYAGLILWLLRIMVLEI